jgi:hypothetical protein
MRQNTQSVERVKEGLGSGLGLIVDVAGPAAWGLAAYVVGSRLLSPGAATLIALGVFFSALALMLGARMQEARARQLARSVCPRCRRDLEIEHEHRRWDGSRSSWLPPLTTWHCRGCDFIQDEPAACPACPEAA